MHLALIILAIAEPLGPAMPTTADMIAAVSKRRQQILAARSAFQLTLLEGSLDTLAGYYGHLEATSFHIDRLCDAILQKRCELVANQYPVCE